MKLEKYYMVHSDNGPTDRKHETVGEAVSEANRLSIVNPNITFNVLGVVLTVEAKKPDPSLDELIIDGINTALNDLDAAEGVEYEEAKSYLEGAIHAIEKAQVKQTQQAFDDSAGDGIDYITKEAMEASLDDEGEEVDAAWIETIELAKKVLEIAASQKD